MQNARMGAGLIGREEQLSTARQFLAARGGLLVLAGEAGMGKSRLAQEVAHIADRSGQRTVWGRPERITQPGPFSLVADLLENIQSVRASDAVSSEVSHATRRIVEPGGTDVTSDLPVRRISAEVRGLMALLGRRPLAILEDMHLADAASLEVILHLVRTAVDDEHLFLATYRTDEVTATESLQRLLSVLNAERLAQEIELAPLGVSESEALASAVLGERATMRDIARIVELSEGVPFFIEELAAVGVDMTSVSIPASVARAVLVRRHALSNSANSVLAASSLAPGSVDIQVLSEALELEASTVRRALVECIRNGLMEERDGRLLFRHALVREALQGDISSLEKEELHRRLALATEKVFSEELPPHSYALALHWYGARNVDMALSYALTAGERALALGATKDARDAFELALVCGPNGSDVPEAVSGLAETQLREGATDEAQRLLERASDLYLTAGNIVSACRTLDRLAWTKILTGHSEEGMPVVERALQIIDSGQYPLDMARLLIRKAQVLINGNELGPGEDALRRAAELAEVGGDHAIRAECLDSLAWVADRRDDLLAFLELTSQACREALLSERAETIGRTHNNRALVLGLRGDIEEALSCLFVAREWLQKSLGGSGVAVVDITEGVVRWRLGQPNLVERLVGRREIVWAHYRGYARILQAWSAEHSGDRLRARAIVAARWQEVGLERTSISESSLGDESVSDAVLCALIVEVEDPSKDTLQLSRILLNSYGDRPADELALAAALMGRTAIALGEEILQYAVSTLEEALSHMESPYFLGLLAEMRAFTEEPAGLRRFHLEQAVDHFKSFGNMVDQARCLRHLAELLAANSERNSAITRLEEARGLATESGSSLELARAELSLRSLGARPRSGRPKKTDAEKRQLSAREEQVAILVADGKTNAEIARSLFLSERTVQDHITHALRKLSLSGRAGLAAWAVRNNLI